MLETLTETEERDCENKLVILLDYDKFDLIKKLLKHREQRPYHSAHYRAHTTEPTLQSPLQSPIQS